PITTAADLELTWLHRDGAAPGTTGLLAGPVYDWPWPAGDASACGHAEAGLLKPVPPYVRKERGLPRSAVLISGYGGRGNDEEGFRTWKSQQEDAVMRPAAT